jgi:hypothetical protein
VVWNARMRKSLNRKVWNIERASGKPNYLRVCF